MGDLTKAEFARLMLSIKSWVAPDVGCDYCHAAPDYASDAKYTKRVARQMMRMTRHINNDWTAHVKGTGVTCYTCHRGKPVPPRVWFQAKQPPANEFLPRKTDGRPPTPSAARTALPPDPLSDFLLGENQIRVVGQTALQTGNPHHIKDARSTYSLMMVMAESLGVNCTYCHNTRSFTSWPLSPPPRVTAWYGIRMARDINNTSMAEMAPLLPRDKLGPAGDGPKVYCATCHMGTFKPLAGVSMLKDFPELIGPKADRDAYQKAIAGLPPPGTMPTELVMGVR